MINVCCIASYERKMRVANTETGLSPSTFTSLCETEKASIDSTGGNIDSNNVSIEHEANVCGMCHVPLFDNKVDPVVVEQK